MDRLKRLKNFKNFLPYVRTHKKYTLIAIVVIAVLGFILLPKKSTAIPVETVKTGNITKTISVTGQVTADKSVNLSFQIAGKLTYLGASKGDFVNANQTIASLDIRTVQKNLEDALLDYSKQRNTFEQTLDNNNAKTINDAANATVKRILQGNQFDLDKSVNSVELISYAQENSYLTTPISGILTREDVVAAGVNVNPATVFTVTDPLSLSFSMDVDEADIGQVQTGQNVDISLDAFPNDALHTTVNSVDFVSHATSTGGNAFGVKVSLPQNANYRVGMSGNADIIVSQKNNVLTVSSLSVTDDGYAYLKTGNKFKKTKVELGLQSDTSAEVLSGLKAGDQVAQDPTSLPKNKLAK